MTRHLNLRGSGLGVGTLKSIMRLGILLVDHQLGYWIKGRPMLARGHFRGFSITETLKRETIRQGELPGLEP